MVIIQIMNRFEPLSKAPEPTKPFRLVKYFSITALVVVALFAVALSSFLAQRSRTVVMTQYEEYANLMATNLNHQVFRQFVLPTVSIYGKIQLSSDTQQRRLDRVVRETIHSLNISQVNIYDIKGVLLYSTDENREIGQTLQGGTDFEAAGAGKSISRLVGDDSLMDYIFNRKLSRPVTMKTLTPFRAEQVGMTYNPRPVLGIFELILDVSVELEQIYRHQVLAALIASGLLAIILAVLIFVVRQGEQILNQRAEERKQLETQLQETQRLAALGRMVASVSHEIKNPLGIIRSTGQLLRDQFPEDDPSRQLAAVIVEECSRLNAVVTEFLDYARPQKPNIRTCMIGELFDRNLDALTPMMDQQGIVVERDYDPEGRIEADPDLLYRALLNVLHNSVQAMPDGGRLIVSVNPDSRGGGCCIEIRDTGPGIATEDMDHIFEPFYTKKDKGTGLGLSIVKSIIEGHNGRIEVVSQEGWGTKMIMII